ncbi:PilX N-terminal domain-containing pilus assembly protein [Pseudomonas sp. 2FE]|uniref:PilX N-terminal domain-containing pilus assembly protein n=1 Tax=Pseudomonas sp. 2FE TaxID=2502190 RepID=UPI0010FA334B|nr:PilX N-terminal domain-containing pilus assembly protein [Pseudomonas sp. 2FE]
MSLPASPHVQRGATLVVGLIMLLLITLIVSSAFTLSGTNLKSVGNMQLRDEAIAAANIAIEEVTSSPFTNAPAAEEVNVDINNDNTTDYVVSIATPVCIRESEVPAVLEGNESGVRAGVLTPPSEWNTVWSLDATVTDPASGAAAHIRSGVRVLLTQTEKDSVCP